MTHDDPSRDVDDYHAALAAPDRAICDVLRREIDAALPDAASKVWHRHPVWFLNDGNPIVGYDRLRDAVRLMFWSGQSFTAPGLVATGTFKAAEARYTDVAEVDTDMLRSWLAESRGVQWNYRDIRRNRGLERLGS